MLNTATMTRFLQRLGGLRYARGQSTSLVRQLSSGAEEETVVSRIGQGGEAVDLAFRHYEGKGTPLLILHGLFGQRKNWHGVVSLLQRASPRPVYVLDLRNHGESPHAERCDYEAMGADLERFVQRRLGGEPADVLGHSMGGKAAAAFALLRPDLVHRLIIEDVTPKSFRNAHSEHQKEIVGYISAMEKMSSELAQFQILPNANTALSEARKFADNYLKDICKDKGTRGFLLTNLIPSKEKGHIHWAVNVSAIHKGFEDVVDFPFERQPEFTGGNEQFSRPTLVVYGQSSDYVKESDHPVFRDFFPDVRFVSVEGSGHWIHSQKPQAFVDIVAEFLQSTE